METMDEKVESNLPLRMTSTVVSGFKRGSKELGIPTANLDPEQTEFNLDASFGGLPTGIYWGFCRITNDTDHEIYKTACSIGYNPYYGNKQKTVEPHLIASKESKHRHQSSCGETLLGEFYDKKIRLTLVGYLRNELPFEGLDNLVAAIKEDILNAERLCDGTDIVTTDEKKWVASDDDASITNKKIKN